MTGVQTCALPIFYEFWWEKEDLYPLRFPHHGIKSDDPLATEEIISLVKEILLTGGEVEICVRGLFEYAEIVPSSFGSVCRIH